jgi:PAS domain-containing protein
MTGADMSPFEQRWRHLGDPAAIKEHLQPEFDASAHPYMLIDPGPGLKIVDINDAYAKATFINRNDVVGKSLFDIFPDNPEDALADGVSNLFSSLATVAQTGKPHAMPIQRYDIRDPNGEFVRRHWQPINTPICDSHGHLVFLLHHVEDVTDQVPRS